MNKNYIGYLSPFLQKNVIPTIAPETTYKFGIIESPLILFNINICKLFFFTEEETMTSYTDYTNLAYSINRNCRTIQTIKKSSFIDITYVRWLFI